MSAFQSLRLLACTALLTSCSQTAKEVAARPPEAGQDQFGPWIKQLGREEIEVRSQARLELSRRIPAAMSALRTAAATDSDPQIRTEAGHLVKQHSAGALLWTYRCPHATDDWEPASVLGWDKDRVYVRCGCVYKLVALDLKTGKIDWEWAPEEHANDFFELCLDQNLILALYHEARKPDRLIAVDANLGKTVWIKKGNLMLHRPVVKGGRVHVGGSEGVRVFDLKTGRETWKAGIPTWTSSPCVTDRWLFAPSDDGKIRAYEASDGAPLWEFTTAGGRVSPLVEFEGRVFGGCPNRLYALDAKSGEKLWDIETTGWSHDGAQVVLGVLVYETNYVGPKDEVNGGWPTLTRIIVVDPGTGSVLQTLDHEAIRGDEFLVAEDHFWRISNDGPQGLNPRNLEPLVAGCASEGCSGDHGFATETLTVEGEEIHVIRDRKGRLRGTRWGFPERTSRVLFSTLGRFPVFSGRSYDGPRNSRVVCIRAVDADQD